MDPNRPPGPSRLQATVPLRGAPTWAILQRHLFDMLDTGWREFERCYCAPDGRLRYSGGMHDRDGVDDFYEPFFNWPVLYRLGGADDLLAASKRHWEGVTVQMTEFGFVKDEFELGYDWFHQGESLVFFYGICAADPDDPAFRARAERFASLYLPDSPSGNYDGAKRMIVAPHNGSGGPRWGVGDQWQEYSADQQEMSVYGLPLEDVEGIRTWDDLADGVNAARMGQAMQLRLGRGDTAVNLAATSLATNAWLYDHDHRFADWVLDYVGAWRERARVNNGLVPDNVGPSGTVGELHGGAWFGGHYGWTWPHGLHSVEAVAMIAALNETLLTSRVDGLDLARVPLDTVLSFCEQRPSVASQGSLGPGFAQKTAVSDDAAVLVVPFRHGRQGWFDYHPMPLVYPVWLWWLTGDEADLQRLERLRSGSGFEWSDITWFHDKEEQGHEAPWIMFLRGENPSYPEEALQLAIGQVEHRIELMRRTPFGPPDDDIHWWQRLNPVVTEVLTQLITGAPPALYNGGLGLARVVFGDGSRGRPGLPSEVAALVTEIAQTAVSLTLVNLGVEHSRTVVVQAGAFAEDRIETVEFDERDHEPGGSARGYAIPPTGVTIGRLDGVGSPRVVVELPPLTQVSLRLTVTRRAFPAHHTSFRTSVD